MTDRRGFFADPPDWPGSLVTAEEPDALSNVLDSVRLRGRAVLRCAPPTPFAVTVPARVRVLHIVERGSLRLRTTATVGSGAVGSGAAESVEMTLGEGDLVLLAR